MVEILDGKKHLPPTSAPPEPAARKSEPKPPKGRAGPLALAIASPLDLGQHKDRDFVGLSIGALYSTHQNLDGIQAGGINHLRKGGHGLQVGGANFTGAAFDGIQVGVVNGSTARPGRDGERPAGCYGVCLGAFHMYGNGAGLHVAPVANATENGRAMLQISLVNHVVHDFSGLQLGLFNFNNFMFSQNRTDIGGGMERVETTTYRYSGQSKAVQISAMNTADALVGANVGLFNMVYNAHRGLALGGFNVSMEMTGVQVGVFNFTRKLDGVQLGVINIAVQNRIPFMVGFNAG